jgi:hypothetical protein
VTLNDWVDRFTGEERTIGLYLAPAEILAQAVAATTVYVGYGPLDAALSATDASPFEPVSAVTT